MEPTEEQRRIVASQARGLVVEAGAGAAKTTTLGLYAGARQRTRILYLAFNKSIQLEAAARMPANVTCRTTHSIAWRKAVELFGKDAAQRVGKTYGSSVSRAFRCGPLAASGALQAIQNWCGSLDDEITSVHVPAEIAERMADPGTVVELARATWERMCRRDGGELRMPHDGYLKLFQMDGPVLRGQDLIGVDEAQDLNLCTYDIVRRQAGGLLLVGDSAQQIFTFRGSANALAMHPADERLQLTRSFRFGAGIAQMANALLGHFKPESTLRIVGTGRAPTRLSVDTKRSFAVLARTNAVVFEEAIAFLTENRGVHDMLTKIAGAIASEVKQDFRNLEAVDEALRTKKPLRAYQQSFDLSKFDSMVQKIADQAVTEIQQRIGPSDDLEHIVLVGGGAHLFQGAVKRKFPGIKISGVADPLYANVRGFQLIGEQYVRENQQLFGDAGKAGSEALVQA